MTNPQAETPVPMTDETMKTYLESASHPSSSQTTANTQGQAMEQVTTGPADNETLNGGTPILGLPSASNVKLPPSNTSAASQSSSIKAISLPRPAHFLRRTDGTITPLVAVDELPAFLHIVGVSRLLTKAQTEGLISVGTLPRSSKLYAVHMMDPQSEAGSDNESVKTIEMQPASSRASNATSIKGNGSRKESVKRWVQGVSQDDDTQSAIDAVIAANTPGKLDYKPISPGVFGAKVYCTHWVRTGECDFTQQGCIFRHEMPDEKTLARMGFRHIPRWFREAGGFDDQIHDVPLARDINEDWRPGTGRGRPRHDTNPPTVFGRGQNQQFTGHVFPVPSFAQSRPVFEGVPGFPQPQPRTRMTYARWPGAPQPTNAPHHRPSPQQSRPWAPPQHVAPNVNSAVGFPTRFNPGFRHQQSVPQTQAQAPALSNPRPPTFLPDDRTPGGSNMSSAASTTSDYSAMTMSAFVPPGRQAPGPRHRQQGTPVRSFQPLTPAPGAQQPVTPAVQPQPQPQPQSSQAGGLFAGAPVAPAPQHRRMFQPPPAPLPRLAIPAHEPKAPGQGNGKGKGSGKSKAVPIVQPKGPKRDDKGGPKDNGNGGTDGKGLVDL